jgi:hypothetical protein
VEKQAPADHLSMAAAGLRREGDDHGAPRLLEHCAVLERMIATQGGTARTRLEQALGGELTTFLCRALTTAPRPASLSVF